MTKQESQRKKSTTPPDTKTQNHFLEKRERRVPPAEISCGADNWGQRYAKSSCQKPINKYNNNWQIK